MLNKTIRRNAAIAALLSLAMAGCGGGTDTGETGLSRVRVINGLIGTSGLVNPALGETALGSRVALGGITGYKGVAPSGQTLRLRRAAEGTGELPGMEPPVFEQAVQTLERGTSYSLVVAGVAGSSDAATAPRLLVLPESDPPVPTTTASPAPGPDPTNGAAAEAAVRVLNLSPDAGPVQLLSGDLPVVSATSVTFGNVSPYIPVIIKDAKLRIRVAPAPGATAATDVPVGSETGAVALTRGRSYTLVLTGLRAPGTGREGLAVLTTAEN